MTEFRVGITRDVVGPDGAPIFDLVCSGRHPAS